MRALLMLVLLLPTAGAWGVEVRAPEVAGAGLPFFVEVCGEGEGSWQLRVLAANATLDVREDRYLPPVEGRSCRDVEVRPANGSILIEARVRPQGGEPQARAFADVRVDDLPWVACETGEVVDEAGRILLRAPVVDGFARVPALPGARLPAPASLRVVELRAPPDEGARIANDGPGPAPLAAWGLGDATLAPGETTFVAMELPKRVLDVAVPKLRAGEAWTPDGIARYGRTELRAQRIEVAGEMIAYATPDSTHAPLVALVDEARAEVLVASHTLTSADVAAALARAADRGALVRVLLEGAPPGGVPADERALAAALQARGVEVLAMGGAGARYQTMHAKLAVIDRAATWVATENLNDGAARGYGLIVRNATLARAVADVLDADARGHDIAPLRADVAPAELVPQPRPDAPAWGAEGARNVTLVLSPDDPRALADAIAAARASVDVAMLRAETDHPMVDALVAAAREGARVRLLLDARFDDGTNRETAARLVALAEKEGLAIEARLDRPDRTLHAKLALLDGEVSYVGSMNWVQAAVEKNREAGLLVEDEGLAAWYGEVFERDWTGPPEEREVPAGVAAALVASAITASLRPRPQRARRGRGRR